VDICRHSDSPTAAVVDPSSPRPTHSQNTHVSPIKDDQQAASNECIQVRGGARLHSPRSETVPPYVPTRRLPVQGGTCRKRCPAPGTQRPRTVAPTVKARRRTNEEPCARTSNFISLHNFHEGGEAATRRVMPAARSGSSLFIITRRRRRSGLKVHERGRPLTPNHPSGPGLSIPSARLEHPAVGDCRRANVQAGTLQGNGQDQQKQPTPAGSARCGQSDRCVAATRHGGGAWDPHSDAPVRHGGTGRVSACERTPDRTAPHGHRHTQTPRYVRRRDVNMSWSPSKRTRGARTILPSS
jgi:hypothetical protein